MLDLRGRGWLARNELAVFVLDREAGEFFLRTPRAEFPGLKIAELFGDRPTARWPRRCAATSCTSTATTTARLRDLVNPFFTPRAAERWRPAMRGFLGELLEPAVRDARPLRVRRGGRQALPVADDRDGAGRAARGRAAAARVVQLRSSGSSTRRR